MACTLNKTDEAEFDRDPGHESAAHMGLILKTCITVVFSNGY
jgi:hypothetical protein